MKLFLQRAPEAGLPQVVGQQLDKILDPDKDLGPVGAGRKETEPQRVDQGVDHEQGIDQRGRQ